jgi:hypothetical protein
MAGKSRGKLELFRVEPVIRSLVRARGVRAKGLTQTDSPPSALAIDRSNQQQQLNQGRDEQ